MRKPAQLRALLAAAAAWLCLACAAPASGQQAYFRSGDVRLRYMVEGQGEPMVLLHGFAGSIHLQWRLPHIMQDLAQNYQVIALDQRGHGLSDRPRDPGQYGVEMVEDVVRLLDHLQIERAHVVGYSMGGFITSKLVATHPQRVLTATLGGAGWSKANDERAGFMKEVAESLDMGQGLGPLLVRLTPPGYLPPDPERLRVMTRMLNLTHDSKALAAAIRGMSQLSVTEEQLRANQVPTLAIVGQLDPLKVTVDELQGVMSNLQTVVIEGADHMDAFVQPEFMQGIEQFLRNESAAAPNLPATAKPETDKPAAAKPGRSKTKSSINGGKSTRGKPTPGKPAASEPAAGKPDTRQAAATGGQPLD